LSKCHPEAVSIITVSTLYEPSLNTTHVQRAARESEREWSVILKAPTPQFSGNDFKTPHSVSRAKEQ